MTYNEALDIVIAKTKHERFRWLCSEENPEHNIWRNKIIELAGGKPDYPSKIQMLKNVAGTMGDVMKSVAQGKPLQASEEEYNRRKAICKDCPFFVLAHERCSKCGCYMKAKASLQAAKCPENKW